MDSEPPPDKVLTFAPTPSFKGWRRFFTKASTRHPAKMNLNMLNWILNNFTRPGEVILDPMAGTGSSIILAALKGRHGIAIEYEANFFEMIKDNIALASKEPWFIEKGLMACIQGDSRRLSELLRDADMIVSSPPYGNRLADVAVKDGDPQRVSYRQAVDGIVSSPAFTGDSVGGSKKEFWERLSNDPSSNRFGRKTHPTSGERYDIVDFVFESPPYSSSKTEVTGEKGNREGDSRQRVKKDYLPISKENIGNLPHGQIDEVVMSQPYEGGPFDHGGGHGGTYAGGIARRDPDLKSIGPRLSEANIGNLKGETYLHAMFLVYSESFKVLRPGGKMVLVTKNFVRDKKIIYLDRDTIKLCEAAGFRLVDRRWFRLPGEGFWRVIYPYRCDHQGGKMKNGAINCKIKGQCSHKGKEERKSCGDYSPLGDKVPRIKYEDILVFSKPLNTI